MGASRGCRSSKGKDVERSHTESSATLDVSLTTLPLIAGRGFSQLFSSLLGTLDP